MITTLQAAEIVIRRKLLVRYIETASGWIALSSSESRLHRGVLPTYEAAVEQAELAIAADELRALESAKHATYDALESGEYWIRPRMITAPGESGSSSVRVFDLMKQDATGNNIVAAPAQESYTGAGIQAVRASKAARGPSQQPVRNPSQ